MNETFDPSKPLKDVQHELFVQNLLKGMSQGKAYVLAGYSKNTAYTCAGKLLRKVDVSARINYLKQKHADKCDITREELISILAQKARGNLCDYLTAGIDGAGYITYGPESKNQLSVKKIKTRTEITKGDTPGQVLITEIELADSISAARTILDAQGWMEPAKVEAGDNLTALLKSIATGDGGYTRAKPTKNGLHKR